MKMLYIGIDLGTSSVKLALFDGHEILRTARRSYPVYHPRDGWSEQNPEDWYAAVLSGIRELVRGLDACDIAGISFSGQMHGLVTLDGDGKVLRRAILWNDGRSDEQAHRLNETPGESYLVEHTGNIAFAGFTAPKLLWMRENEPDLFARIDKVLLPKDYIAYRLTGRAATDVTDASGTLLFDVKNRSWSQEMCELCGVRKEWLPDVLESTQASGTLCPQVCDLLGLCPRTKVIIGAGDNAASAVGVGATADGACNISLGTSGTMLVSCKEYVRLSNHSVHFFCHANGSYLALACILSAACADDWWIKTVLQSDFNYEENKISELGNNHTYFLPYLAGERSPHNDTRARGAFVGLSLSTAREDMTLAVMEGVAFAFRDNLEVLRKSGIDVQSATVCGGGASSRLWLKILCNVLDIPLRVSQDRSAAGYGAAQLAAQGCGMKMLFPEQDGVLYAPQSEIAERYRERYRHFSMLYGALKTTYDDSFN